jgi:hypothetical protein
MARTRLENLLSEFSSSVNKRIDRLSSQVKIYGAVVTLGVVAIPVYGQITTVNAKAQIEQVVDSRVEPAVVRAADLAATKAVQKLKEKQYCE